jgi:hypothetical protein
MGTNSRLMDGPKAIQGPVDRPVPPDRSHANDTAQFNGRRRAQRCCILLQTRNSEMWRFNRAHLSAHRQAILRFAASISVVLCLSAVQLYLYSPWHMRPAQGQQYCSFFNVEQGNGLEASGPVIFVPPPTPHDVIPEEQAWCATSLVILRQTSRGPPA